MMMIDVIKNYLTDEELRMFDCGIYPPFYHERDIYFIEGRFVRVPEDAKYRISACTGKYVHGRDKVKFFFGPVTWQAYDRNNKPIKWQSDISDKLWDAWWQAAEDEINVGKAKRQFTEDKELKAAVKRAKAKPTKSIDRAHFKFLIVTLLIASIVGTVVFTSYDKVEAYRVEREAQECEIQHEEYVAEQGEYERTPNYPYEIVIDDIDSIDWRDSSIINENDAYEAFYASYSTNVQFVAARHIVQFQTYPTKEEMRHILMEDIRTGNFYINKYDAKYSFTEEDVDEFIKEIYHPNCVAH